MFESISHSFIIVPQFLCQVFQINLLHKLPLSNLCKYLTSYELLIQHLKLHSQSLNVTMSKLKLYFASTLNNYEECWA